MNRFFAPFYGLVALCCLSAALSVAGCGKKEPVVLTCYCSETFWELMREETRAFERLYGIRIDLIPILPADLPKAAQTSEEPEREPARRSPTPWRNRPRIRQPLLSRRFSLDEGIADTIRSLGVERSADLYLTDSPEQLDLLKEQGLASHVYPFCYLTMVLLVPKGNPQAIGSVQDALSKRLRLGLTSPSRDGMGSVAWSIVSQTPLAALEESLDASVRFFDMQSDLLDALRNDRVDAALVWDFLIPNSAGFADVVSLSEPGDDETAATGRERRVMPQSLISLNTAPDEGYGKRFADFLISEQGRQILQRHGFVPKPL